jgi:hypothetical protein
VTSRSTVVVLALAALSACKSPHARQETAVPKDGASRQADPVCHPIVSGCGCAYQCARGMRVDDTGRWQVTHDFQDSRLDDAVVERWCFDASGHGSRAGGAQVEATQCLDVFYDLTPCGGKCLPTVQYLRCHALANEDYCAP